MVPLLPFRQRYTADERREQLRRVSKRLSTHVPVVVEAARGDPPLPLPNDRFLVPSDLTLGHLLHLVRSRIWRLEGEQALFLLVGGALLPAHQTLRSVHDAHAEEGFLYVAVGKERAFG